MLRIVTKIILLFRAAGCVIFCITKGYEMTPQNDPAKPLSDAVHETFCKLIVAGKPAYEAYKVARGGRHKNATAKPQASRWIRIPEIAARLKWLQIQAAETAQTQPKPQNTQPAETPKRNLKPPPSPSSTSEAMGRAELYALITAEIRAGRVDPALVSSLLKVAPELGEVDQSRPDPTAVISYACSFAGRTGDEIARELGGLEFIADKICTVLKVSPLDLGSILMSKGHAKVTDPQPTQAGNESHLISNITQEQDEQPKAGNTGGEGGQGGAAC